MIDTTITRVELTDDKLVLSTNKETVTVNIKLDNNYEPIKQLFDVTTHQNNIEVSGSSRVYKTNLGFKQTMFMLKEVNYLFKA